MFARRTNTTVEGVDHTKGKALNCIAFGMSVQAGSLDPRKPTTAELQTWKTQLVHLAQGRFGHVDLNSMVQCLIEGSDEKIRVVPFYVKGQRRMLWQDISKTSSFNVAANGRPVLGLSPLGIIMDAKTEIPEKGSTVKIKPFDITFK